MKTTVWFDLQQTIKDRIKVLKEDVFACKNMDELHEIKGQIIAWTELLGLPAYLKDCAHHEQGTDKEEARYERERETTE